LAKTNVEESHDPPELTGISALLLPACLILGGTVLIGIYQTIFGEDTNSSVGDVSGAGDGGCNGGGFGGGASGGGGAGGSW